MKKESNLLCFLIFAFASSFCFFLISRYWILLLNLSFIWSLSVTNMVLDLFSPIFLLLTSLILFFMSFRELILLSSFPLLMSIISLLFIFSIVKGYLIVSLFPFLKGKIFSSFISFTILFSLSFFTSSLFIKSSKVINFTFSCCFSCSFSSLFISFFIFFSSINSKLLSFNFII